MGYVISLGLGKRKFLICRGWASPLPEFGSVWLESGIWKKEISLFAGVWASPIAELTYWGLHQCGTGGPSMSKSPGTHLSTEKEEER